MMSRYAVLAALVLAPGIAVAQVDTASIRVTPAVVSVRSDGATTAILTYSGLGGYSPAEALWCAKLASSAGHGAACDPSAIYGQALGVMRSASPGGLFIDVMSVSASVAQRAYEAALAGQPARFYYVRRFQSNSAIKAYAPDQYVVVTCVLGGSGANAPFALTNVRLRTEPDMPVLFVKRGDRPPPWTAEIAYTGTGRLRGRWEVVMPGEDGPSAHDLMTEGSLPSAERGLQRRYRELERFNVPLLPTGRFTLPGPDPARLPVSVDGTYLILLRIETSDDALSDTRIAGLGGTTVIHNGAAAAFPMPTLRYIVGATGAPTTPARIPQSVRLRLPLSGISMAPDSALTLSWTADRNAVRYRVEIESQPDGATVLSAVVSADVGHYDVPPFVLTQTTSGRLRWRVVALDDSGRDVARSEWRTIQRRRGS